MDFELLSNSLTFECRNPRLPKRDAAINNADLRQVLNSGGLVDDDLANGLVLDGLDQRQGRGVVLDGFPRNRAQADLLSRCDTSVSFALQFDVPDAVCTMKLLGRRQCSTCGGNFNVAKVERDGFVMPPMIPTGDCCDSPNWKKRGDDNRNTIRTRMNVYHEETKPVLEFWSEQNKLLRFVPYRGTQEMDRLEKLVTTRLEEMR